MCEIMTEVCGRSACYFLCLLACLWRDGGRGDDFGWGCISNLLSRRGMKGALARRVKL